MKNMKHFILAAIFLAGCSGNYFKVADTSYEASEQVTDDIGAITETLVLLGYEIDEANSSEVKTKAERFYYDKGRIYEVELQSWITVNLKTGHIKAYCTQRGMYSYVNTGSGRKKVYDKNWKFTPCKNPSILKRIDIAIKTLEQQMTLGV